MLHDDPLVRLLRAADSIAGPPAVSADLPEQVRRRRLAQIAKTQRIKVAAVTTVAVILSITSIGTLWKPRPSERPIAIPKDLPIPMQSETNPANIAQLLTAAATARKEADALEAQIQELQTTADHERLHTQYRQLLAQSVEHSITPSGSDNAAMIGLCQGDFYWQQYEDREEATAAWQNVIDRFATTQWAAVAQQRIQQLPMN
jgi:hypothetical protein